MTRSSSHAADIGQRSSRSRVWVGLVTLAVLIAEIAVSNYTKASLARELTLFAVVAAGIAFFGYLDGRWRALAIVSVGWIATMIGSDVLRGVTGWRYYESPPRVEKSYSDAVFIPLLPIPLVLAGAGVALRIRRDRRIATTSSTYPAAPQTQTGETRTTG